MYLALTVRVLVLPDPGPAITRDGPSTAVIAALCSGLILSGLTEKLIRSMLRSKRTARCRYLQNSNNVRVALRRRPLLSTLLRAIPEHRGTRSFSLLALWLTRSAPSI